MKKLVYLLIAAAVVYGIFVFTQDSTAPTEGNDSSIETSTNTQTTNDSSADATSEVVIDGEGYAISDESTVSYTVQKGWLSKPSEDVTGVNESVDGYIMYDGETVMGVNAIVDASAFSTGNEGRDKDVAKLLPGNITIAAEDLDIALATGETFEGNVTVDLTINGVTQPVTFAVVATAEESSISVDGDATVVMSDFDVKAPSMLNVYNVADEFQMSFSVVATK